MLKRYWVSWYEGSDDYRPTTFPPNEAIIGWWCSGETFEGESILCAVVEAENEDEVAKAISKDWPGQENLNFRFMEEREKDWEPGDRFPKSDWMEERFSKKGE